jgi:hypothetical protein
MKEDKIDIIFKKIFYILNLIMKVASVILIITAIVMFFRTPFNLETFFLCLLGIIIGYSLLTNGELISEV